MATSTQYRVVFAPSMQIAADRQGNYVQVHGGDSEVLYRMNAGDVVLFYATQMTRSNETRHDAFVAVARVSGKAPYSVEDDEDTMNGGKKWRKSAEFLTLEKELHWESIEDDLINRIEPSDWDMGMEQGSMLLDPEAGEFIFSEMNIVSGE